MKKIQIDEIDQPHQTNEMNQTNQMNQPRPDKDLFCQRLGLYGSSDLPVAFLPEALQANADPETHFLASHPLRGNETSLPSA